MIDPSKKPYETPVSTAGQLTQTRQPGDQSTGRELKAKAREGIDEAKDKAQEAAGKAGDYAVKLARDQKETLANKVDEYRDAAKAAVEKLQDEEHAVAADKIKWAASSLDRLSKYLRETEPRELLQGANDFARRRPEVVFGGLFMVGLGLARFLKASNEPRRDQRSSQSYPSPASPTTGYATTTYSRRGEVGSR
ncbi:MAG: YtxH domain-containing protein [Chthoniobacterales bacterium]